MARRNQGPRLRYLKKRCAYYITWTEHGRSRERSTGTADRERAEIVFGEFLQARGRTGPSDPSEMLVTDALTDYARERGPKVTAPEVMGRAIVMLAGFWEGRVVADVRPQTCSLYCQTRKRAAGTVRRELGVLQAAINHAHRNGRLTRSVAVELKEAILSLRWPQVDLEAGLIDFETPGRERTNKRRGKVPIPAKLLPHLKRARKRGADVGYVLHINGQRIRNIKKGFAAACRRAGLEGVSPHTLRHTAATWLMQAGVSHWQAAGFLAMSEKTLREVYGHHHPDYLREAAQGISKRLRPVRGMSA